MYDKNLDKCAANYQPLSPLQFLKRAALAFPKKTAIIHGKTRFSYSDFYNRCRQLASSLHAKGVKKGDTVSIMAPNIPPMLEAHYGVPMTKGVLNTLNIRLDPTTLAFILNHSESKVLITDTEYSKVIKNALKSVSKEILVIDIQDSLGEGGDRLGDILYEDFVSEGDTEFLWEMPDDEWDAISLNYTSGTTGHPKGVVYHHRGAYLLAIGNLLAWDMPKHPVYLWTLPMFHCNGWCFPWTLSINMGTHVCLRRTDPKAIFDAIVSHDVTHLCGAPIVMNMVANAPDNIRQPLKNKVNLATAAAPPPSAVISRVEGAGFDVTHLYGLTETYGPSVVNEWNSDWDTMPETSRSEMKARQGVRYPTLEELMVADPDTLKPVPTDGATIGEVFFRGNVVMKGYLKNSTATKKAFSQGWFHSGDLGVVHEDGYIELKDRSKDIIISGGENISTIEVENILYRHPAVAEAAVVAQQDEKWGEVPCAFVSTKSNMILSANELIDFCRKNLAHYKVPKNIIFCELPKTSTGKIQKFILREKIQKL